MLLCGELKGANIVEEGLKISKILSAAEGSLDSHGNKASVTLDGCYIERFQCECEICIPIGIISDGGLPVVGGEKGCLKDASLLEVSIGAGLDGVEGVVGDGAVRGDIDTVYLKSVDYGSMSRFNRA